MGKGSVLGKRFAAYFGSRDPVYVFHHIPKCGGSSIRTALSEWFIRRKDYRRGWSESYPPAYDLSQFRSIHCLCGHFELEGYYLRQRYPEVFASNRFRVFTFVREPLALQVSLYRFLQKKGQPTLETAEAHIFTRPNYLARMLSVDEGNFEESMKKYFFIGILERAQESMDRLALAIGKKPIELPWVNRTQGGGEESDTHGLSSEVMERFRSVNALDYRIYEYCLERFDRG